MAASRLKCGPCLAGYINKRVKNAFPSDPDLSGETLDFCGTGYRRWRPAVREHQPHMPNFEQVSALASICIVLFARNEFSQDIVLC
jgi:hypothetical protein